VGGGGGGGGGGGSCAAVVLVTNKNAVSIFVCWCFGCKKVRRYVLIWVLALHVVKGCCKIAGHYIETGCSVATVCRAWHENCRPWLAVSF